MPLDEAVWLGPPDGIPQAAVSARDVSEGGLFIDADRPVRVGARFSISLPFEDCSIYVPEAEVAYNADNPSGGGFGVRFLRLDRSARSALSKLIQRRQQSFHTAEDGRDTFINEASLVPSVLPHDSDDLSLPEYPEPQLSDDSLDLEAMIQLPKDEMSPVIHWRERLKTLPWKHLGGFMLGASLLLVIATLAQAIYSELSVEEVELVSAEQPEGVDPATHQRLMGEAQAAVWPAPKAAREEESEAALEAELEAGGALPELKSLEEALLEAEALRGRPAVVKPRRVAPEPEPATPNAKEPALRALPVAPEKPAKLAKAPAPTAARAPAPVKAQPRAAKAKPAAAKAPAKAPAKASEQAALSMAARNLLGDAKVGIKKSFVLKNPDRFVVDIAEENSKLRLPKVGGQILQVRLGFHKGYTRVVFDLKKPIKSGEARISGDALQVILKP